MKFSIFILTFFFLAACSDKGELTTLSEVNPGSSSSIAEIPTGMLLVEGSSDTVFLGTDNKNAKESERPRMRVVLDYDFFLDIHETTCGDFLALMDSVKISGCESDNLPVSNVTFYDAALFANRKSRRAGLDTVYEYSGAIFDKNGSATDLSGFSVRLDRNGFRLPTEAEWVKAAQGNFSFSKSFHNSNSGFKAHPVCELEKDSAVFCDLSGNLMEWVNDPLGHLVDTLVVNFAGASNTNDLNERVVKGGHFSLDTASIHLYSRGDVYAVTPASSADYVGFRLARGKIPNAVYLDSDGKISADPIKLLADAAELYTYFKTSNVKLAFRNDQTGNLVYIDYSAENPSPVEIEDTIGVYHPVISPDGNFVAFCTGLEGISGKSALYVRHLDSAGSNLVKLGVESAAIPRFQVLENGDTVVLYVTDAGNNKENADFKARSTWQVPFSNGKFGTPQKLFDGAFHGGVSYDRKLAVTGARLLRANLADSGSTLLENADDTVWYNGEQACNASLAMLGKRTLFLDFASATGKKFVGGSYQPHEFLFVADSAGKLVQSVKAPGGYAFDHTEWADGLGEHFVASLTNADGAHNRMVLIRTSDSSLLNLVEGSELWHPNLWTDRVEKRPESERDTLPSDTTKGFVLDPDSAGQYYNTSGACPWALQFRYKMELLWQYRDSVNTVIMGSSRAYFGISPEYFSEPLFAINLATQAQTLYGTNQFLEQYIFPHLKKLKVIVLVIDPDRGSINNGHNKDNMFYTAWESYPGYVYDKNHNYWVDGVPKGLDSLTYNSPGNASSATKLRKNRGFWPNSSKSWGEASLGSDTVWNEVRFAIYYTHFATLTSLLETCREKNITVIGVLTPMHPGYRETGAYGYRGLQRSKAVELIEELSALHETYPNFYLMDENKMGNHDYTDEMANDHSHLSGLGAAQLSRRIDSLITKLGISVE